MNLTLKFLVFLLLTSVIPLLVVGWTSYDISQTIIQEQVSNYTQELMVEHKNYMELMLEQVESLITNISSIEEVKTALANTSAQTDDYAKLVTQARIGYILSSYASLKGLVSIDIFTPSDVHYHVGDTLNVQLIRNDLKDQLFKEALQSDKPILWAGVEDNVNLNSQSPKVVTAAKILRTTDPKTLRENPVGLILVNLSVDNFREPFLQTDLGPNAYIIIVDAKHRIVSSPDPSQIGLLIDPTFQQHLTNAKGSFVENLDGQMMFVTYSQSTENDWQVISFIPLRNLTEQAMRISQNTAWILLGCFSLIVVLAFYVSHQVVEPIKKITQLFKGLQEGTVKTSVKLKEGAQDEIGELIKWFNTFLESLADKKRAEDALRDSEERYALAVQGAHDGLWDWNLKTETVYFSPRWQAMVGSAEAALNGTLADWFNQVHPDDLAKLQSDLQLHLEGESAHFENEHRILHTNGLYRWMLSRGLAVRDATGRAYRMAGSLTDITDRKAAEARLLHDTLHDALTGLPNRVLFVDRLGHAISRTKRHSAPSFAMLFLDLDRFKLVNDSLGHLMGDELLVAIARRLEQCIRPGDTVARFGGDEFAILLEDVQDKNDATAVADRVQAELSAPFKLGSQPITMSASIGIALNASNSDQPEDIIRDADTAMYRAKSLGKARYEVFATAMHTNVVAQMQLEADLRLAVSRGELRVYYLPIVALDTGRITGAEALVRWQHPQRGLIPPSEFIAMAEESGLIMPMGEWVLKTACKHVKVWHLAGFPHLRVAVNISARQFENPALAQFIAQTLEDTALSPNALEIEITETIAMKDTALSLKTLTELSEMKIKTSIDDFGKSYSSLSYLKRFPFATLKIDQWFVQEFKGDAEDAAILNAIVNMAHNLKLKVIAEGVETLSQLDFLRSLACDEMQGYLFSPPLIAKEFRRLLQNERSLAPLWYRVDSSQSMARKETI